MTPSLRRLSSTLLGRLRHAAVVASLAGLVASAPAGAQTPDVHPLLAEALDGGLPAIGVVVIRDGRVEQTELRGVRRLGEAAPVQSDDRWHLGSNGKAMTATLIARLVDQGRLSWSAPLSQMLPQLAESMRPEYRDVTLVDLLSHRAGLREPTDGTDAFFQAFYSDTRPLPEQRMDWVSRTLSLEPVGPVGGAAHYSNSGYLLAGVIAEQALGVPYEQLMMTHVLQPLGMDSATFARATEAGEIAGHVDGRVAGLSDANPLMDSPAGGLRMSLADWAKFSIDQMEGVHGRGRLMSQDAYLMMQTLHGEEGLGWSIAPGFQGRQGPMLNHTGSDGNWFSGAVLFPRTRDGVLVVTNGGRSLGGEEAIFSVAAPVLMTLSVSASE